VPQSMCGSGARWCARADAIFNVPDMHVVDVEIDDWQRLVLTNRVGSVRPPVRLVAWVRSAVAVESVCCTMRRASPGSPY
jgi:hypothetical protein